MEFLCASNNVKVMEHVYQNAGNIVSKDSLIA
jgi:DNA-binding winged helix-turn-helix (wHTH) protein